MRRIWMAWAVALPLAGPGIAVAQDAPADTAARFEKSLRKLSSEDYEEREAASRAIAELPADALRLVEAELKKKDLELEVRSRLERLVPGLQAKVHRQVLARRNEAVHAWTHRTVVDAYERAGRKDPRWDPKVRELLPLVVSMWSQSKSPVADPAKRAYELSEEAVRSGCDDPLVLYVLARMYDTAIRKDWQEAVKLHVGAGQAMKERGSEYPPIRQAFVYARAADFRLRSKKEPAEGDREETRVWLELALARFAEAAKDPAVPDTLLFECGEALIGTWKRLAGDRKAGFDKVAEVLTQGRPDSRVSLVLKGAVYISYAWDARGSGWASSVTEEGWRLMRERLAESEAALTRAWEKDPSDAQAATLMIGVELGQGKGRPAMETWFRRAMEADPDNLEACKKKIYYLEPKWHGSADDMIEFGRQLLAGGNWEARLPFQLMDAHLTLAGYEKDKPAYYQREEVWKDVQAVYETYLARHPDSAQDRTWYAKLASYCGRHREANRQFEILGDKAVVSVFANRAELDRLKAEAAAKGK